MQDISKKASILVILFYEKELSKLATGSTPNTIMCCDHIPRSDNLPIEIRQNAPDAEYRSGSAIGY